MRRRWQGAALLAVVSSLASGEAHAQAPPASQAAPAPPASPGGAAPNTAGPLRLEDAVHLALQHNERAQKAPYRVEIAEGSKDRARDAFFPTLVGQSASTLTPPQTKQQQAFTTNETLTLTQPLFNPSSFPLFWQSDHTLESEKWGAVQDKRQLTFDTAKAFLTALSSESLLASAKQKLETARANLENAQARAQAGLSSTNDVTKASLDTQTSAQQVAQTQGNVERAYLALSFLVGHAVSGPLAPPTKTTESALHFEATAGSQVAAALERRPDLKSQHEKVEAAWYFAAEPLWRLAPTVSAAGQLRYTPEPIPPANGLTESLTLNLTWTIFDSGFRYADRRTRLAQARSSALDEQYLRRSVETDIATALSSLHTARETYAIAAQAVTFAQKNQDEVAILYKQGLVNGLEVTDANQKRFDAEVVREAAKLAMEQAYLDLRSALGFGPLDDDPAGTQ